MLKPYTIKIHFPNVYTAMVIGFCTFLAIATGAFATETDQFTGRFNELVQLEDSTDILDQWTNERISMAADRLNQLEAKSPKKELSLKQIKQYFISPTLLVSVAANKMYFPKSHKTLKIPHYKAPKKGIFWKTKLADVKFLQIIGLSPTLKMNGQLVGIDKLVHFFAEGFHYYSVYKENLKKDGSNKAEAMSAAREVGHQTEMTNYGLTTDGVYSLGDMAANWKGFLFVKDLMEGNDAYLTKVDGKWKQVRTFSFREYVTPDWDEVINPSFAVNQRAFDRVQKNIKAMCANDSAYFNGMKGIHPIMSGDYAPKEPFFSNLRFSFDCGEKKPISYLDLF